MANPISIPIQSSPFNKPLTTRRKRSQSTAEIFTISSPAPYDTKRARIGIQELPTGSTPKPPIPQIPRPTFNLTQQSPNQARDQKPTFLGADITSDDEGTSSDDNGHESSIESHLDEGYDLDSESESTTTSSSSSSSDTDSEINSADEDEEETRSSRSGTIGFLSPEQFRTSTSANAAGGSSSLLAKRLDSFIPRLAAANVQLEQEREKGILGDRNIEAIGEEGRYIEMNLGLGVLEQKHEVGPFQGSDNDGDESEAWSGKSRTKGRSKKHDAMAALMGRKGAKKSSIQVMD